jgi:hypothetical protein
MNINNRNKTEEYLNSHTANGKDTKEAKMKTNAEHIKEMLDNTRFLSEDEKQAYDAKINEKIKNGDKLTPSEMEYIRRTNPALYQKIKRIQFKREMLEKKLKNCKSKKEVTEVSSEAFLSIDKKDPDRSPLIAAYNNAIKEFKKSPTYSKLPMETKEEREKEKKVKEKREPVYDYTGIERKRSWLDVNA